MTLSLWHKQGGLIYRNNSLIVCDRCPCEGVPVDSSSGSQEGEYSECLMRTLPLVLYADGNPITLVDYADVTPLCGGALDSESVVVAGVWSGIIDLGGGNIAQVLVWERRDASEFRLLYSEQDSDENCTFTSSESITCAMVTSNDPLILDFTSIQVTEEP